MDKLFGSGIFRPGTSLPSSPGPPSPEKRKRDRKQCKDKAERLAREKLIEERGRPSSSRIRREPSYMETNPPSPKVEYFSTNPYGAGSSTSIYRNPETFRESDEEIELPPLSPLLTNVEHRLLPLPPVLPENQEEELSSDEEIDRTQANTQAMGAQMTEPQLQAIVTAAIRAVNGDERNLKTPEQKPFSGRAEDLANFVQECELRFKVYPTTYSNANKKIFYALSLMNSGNAKV